MQIDPDPYYREAPLVRRSAWLTIVSHVMGGVLMLLAAALAIEWMAIVAESIVEWVWRGSWPSAAFPLWLHAALPTLALATGCFGRWVTRQA